MGLQGSADYIALLLLGLVLPGNHRAAYPKHHHELIIDDLIGLELVDDLTRLCGEHEHPYVKRTRAPRQLDKSGVGLCSYES